MQVSSINGSTGERMFVSVCVCVEAPCWASGWAVWLWPMTGGWNQARSSESPGLLSHTQPGQARWLLTSLRLKLTSPHLPSLHGDRDAELPRHTHVWDDVRPPLRLIHMPIIQSWSCTSFKNLTPLLVSCLVSALHFLSHLLILLSSRVFCSNLFLFLSSCLVLSPLCSLLLCLFTSDLLLFPLL